MNEEQKQYPPVKFLFFTTICTCKTIVQWTNQMSHSNTNMHHLEDRTPQMDHIFMVCIISVVHMGGVPIVLYTSFARLSSNSSAKINSPSSPSICMRMSRNILSTNLYLTTKEFVATTVLKSKRMKNCLGGSF